MTRGQPPIGITLAQATHFAQLALDCIQRELPNSILHVINGPDDIQSPRALHPAFYGCLDWHSAVHGHWLLVRLLRVCPELPQAAAIRAALDANLTADHLAAELAYFQAPHRGPYERPYGWAWLLQLAGEVVWLSLGSGASADAARRWHANLGPLVDEIVERYQKFLPKQTYPIRSGAHFNTAFGLALAIDYAHTIGSTAFLDVLDQRVQSYYVADRDAPAHWEPGGDEFLSPALIEADLVRRILPAEHFATWLHAFLPRGLPPSLQAPAIVSDRSDGKLAHLDGLNLSRAWCLRSIAGALPADDRLRAELTAAFELHAAAGLANVATGDYMGEHWLATFAVYLLTT